MLTAVEVENFRGIERLSVSGLGRVNLIIGKNNAGKTALMEAIGAVGVVEDAGNWLSAMQYSRMPEMDFSDFDNFWRPIFRSGDAERGFIIRATRSAGLPVHLTMHQVRREQLVAHGPPSATTLKRLDWALEYTIEAQKTRRFKVSYRTGNRGVSFPPILYPDAQSAWIGSGPSDLIEAIRLLSTLKQQGRDEQVRSLLHQLDERIAGLEILSPTGSQAAVFVRVAGEPMLLPFQAMGEGVQRCFDIAAALAGSDAPFLAVDEIENGLHHSVLESVWRWLAEISTARKVQVFATTHSEECVQAACRAFSALNDDGLRVIRLDRKEHQTVATVYDRNLVEAAGRMGVEIRG